MHGNSEVNRAYEQLTDRFVKWAETRPDIRAAAIVGSRARIDHPADEWADLDILVVTVDPERYLSSAEWVQEIGKPLLTFLEPTASGDNVERRVLYEGMLDVDFAIIPLEKAVQLFEGKIPPQMTTQIVNTFGRGIRILLDKDGKTGQLQAVVSSIQKPKPQPPTHKEFQDLVSDFLYHAVFTAKHLRRGELWWAIMCIDCYMQSRLLRMIEWHANAKHDWSYDTWFRGRFLEEWTDPRVLKGLRDSFAYYDKKDIGRALLEAMNLFRWISMETAEKLKYPYPTEVDELVTDWITTCLSEKEI